MSSLVDAARAKEVVRVSENSSAQKDVILRTAEKTWPELSAASQIFDTCAVSLMCRICGDSSTWIWRARYVIMWMTLSSCMRKSQVALALSKSLARVQKRRTHNVLESVRGHRKLNICTLVMRVANIGPFKNCFLRCSSEHMLHRTRF